MTCDLWNVSDEERARGIDGDLTLCLAYNPQDGFTAADLARVLAVYEGERDGDDWRWIALLRDGRFVAIRGGCDYTGWDCQSWATSDVVPTIADAVAWFRDDDAAVFIDLVAQLLDAKTKTWTETIQQEFGSP